MATRINWTLKQFRLDELTDYYKNPRSLSEKEFKQLKTSLDKFGMIDKPIVNADSAHTIIGGHQRKHVLEATGVKEIECWIPDRELSDKEVEELNIRLNKNTGSWDFDTLANEFELDDLLEWGFDKGELDLDLWADEAPEDVEPQIDKAEELREKWGVESGQLWQLGEHRLICGDCTDKAVVDRVMGGERADMVFTDPPYKAEMQGAGLAIDKESVKSWGNYGSGSDFDLLDFGSEFNNLLFGSTNNLLFLVTYNQVYDLLSEAKQRGMKHRLLPICKQMSPFPSSSNWSIDMNWGVHIYDHPRGKTNNKSWVVIDKATDVEAKKTVAHPSPYRLDLLERFVDIASLPDDKVLEPFCGGGSTLIACERLGRKCRAVEISPAYVAVAIQRWVDVTGGEPVLLTL